MRRVFPSLVTVLIAACGSGPAARAPASNEPDVAKSTVGDPCPAERDVFEQEVHGPILVPLCSGCHNPTGEARHTRLAVVTAGEDPVLANWRSAGALAAMDVDGESLLLLRASGRHPEGHAGGALVLHRTANHDALSNFVDDARDPACNERPPPSEDCDAPPFGPPLLRRLTHDEYDATIEAVFGGTSTRGASLAGDRTQGGFDNHARTLVVDSLLADQMRLNAEAIAARAVENLASILPCTPSAGQEQGCRDLFIDTFITKAYRRAPSAEEKTRYAALFDAAARGDFSQGVRWVLVAAMQSPHFLYRSELGDPVEDGTSRLTANEIATQLSYSLTGGPPDDDLRRAAQSERLYDPDERERQARRLIASPAGQRHTARFFDAWLALDRLDTVAKDGTTYPELTPAIRAAMREETHRFVTRTLLRGTGRFPELLTAPHSFVTPELAAFYNEAATGEPDADGFARVESPGRRFGLLTQGSLLTVHAKASDASPIHRGKLVRERLLCQSLPLPPPGLVIESPPVDPSRSARERLAEHAEVEPCRSCHRLIDPIGFGFSNYDGIGRFRATEAGRPVDASGEIVGTSSTDAAFENLEVLARTLADAPDVRSCFSRTWSRWAYGLEPEGGLACALQDAHAAFGTSDWRVDALLVALARSEHLVRRTAP